jgi:aspartyl-tRNA(Asn)/glutamyl-tRNA(Gln) amidotransferase subunit C
MTQKLTHDQVRHVAKLSRLRLSDGEVEHFAHQLSAVLDYVAKIEELDVSQVEPMAHPMDAANVFRDDVPEPGMAIDAALGNAPRRDGDFFEVPKVLGEGSGA